MSISAKTKLCMVIGDPVEHSLSPAMHNAGYKAAGLDSEFVYTGAHITPENLESFVNAVRVLNIRGVSCTMPHKQAIMPLLDKIDPVAQKIGAVNTIVNNNGILTGSNTDWIGAIAPLETLTELKGKRVAVLGAGGSARAVIYGLVSRDAELTCFNRTYNKAVQLAQEFGCKAQPLVAAAELYSADIYVNTIPNSEGLFPEGFRAPGRIVFDIVYSKKTNPVISDAKEAGCKVLTGHDMLLHQGMAQFALFTGVPAPEQAMRRALEGVAL